jgi:hypothetical protein
MMEDKNILFKSLHKLIRVGIGRAEGEREKIRAKANLLRRLYHFRDLLHSEMKKLSDELIDVKVEEYFGDVTEKVIVTKDKTTQTDYIEISSFKKSDWKKCLRQYKERGYLPVKPKPIKDSDEIQ